MSFSLLTLNLLLCTKILSFLKNLKIPMVTIINDMNWKSLIFIVFHIYIEITHGMMSYKCE